ncbi:GNAT family N-acetyltransferase [Rubrivirga sp.]|uniref:GNAT family N-acetyltransferase n=1 Tax=Rubrivirga sp. TaxID=1885344 RepID=UPI003B523553
MPSASDLPPGIHRATASGYDAERLGRAMSAAFIDDAGGMYLWPDPDERRRALQWYYGVLVPRLGFGGGRLYVGDGGAGQSVWIAPGNGVGLASGVRAGALGFPRRYGAAATWRLKKLSDTIDALRREAAPPGHWYLLLLGVEPEAQGTGLGARLMAPMIAEANREGRAVYLETSTPSNLPYYRGHGFEVVGERRVPGGHGYWGMARPPA